MGSAAGIRAGRAYVEMGADDTALEKGLRAAEKRLKAFGQSVGAIGAAISGLGAAITAPLFGAAKSFADAGSALNDMSERTGVSVETLSALGYAAAQTGTDIETVEGAFQKMARAVSQGTEENLQAQASFAALGLSARQLGKLAPEQAFGVIAKQISKIPNEFAKANMQMAIFGKSGTALAGMIDDLDALTNEAKAFGLVFTGEEVKRAGDFGSALGLLKAVLDRVVTAVGAELAPLLTDVAIDLARAAKVAIDWAKANGPLIVTAFKFGVALVAAGAAIAGLGVAIVGVGAVLGGMAAILAFLLNPITLIVAALAGLTAAFLLFTETGGRALAWLGDRFGEFKATAVEAFGGIADAMKAGDIRLAAQVLWAAVKVEWLKGTNYLGEVTRAGLDYLYEKFDVFRYGLASLVVDLMDGVRSAFVTGWHAVAGVFESAWAGIKSGWYALWNGFNDVFDAFGKSFVGKLITLVGEVRKEMAIAKGFFTLSSSSHAVAEIEKETESRRAGFNKDLADRKKERDDAAKAVPTDAAKAARDRAAKQQDELAKIGQGNLDKHKALDDQQKAAAEARVAAAREAGAAGVEELKKAQDELDRLAAEAKAKAAGVGGIADKSKGGPEAGLTPRSLDKAIEDTKLKVSTAGSFSASAAAGLGAGEDVASLAKKQVDEQQKTNDHLKQLNRKVDKKKAAQFA